jgi:hypothetical protein
MLRRVWVSILCEIPSIMHLSSPWRRGPSRSAWTIRQVYLSAIQFSAWGDSQLWLSTLGSTPLTLSIVGFYRFL